MSLLVGFNIVVAQKFFFFFFRIPFKILGKHICQLYTWYTPIKMAFFQILHGFNPSIGPGAKHRSRLSRDDLKHLKAVGVAGKRSVGNAQGPLRGVLCFSDENWGTGWGPQDSVQLPNISGFMVDITIVNRGYNGL